MIALQNNIQVKTTHRIELMRLKKFALKKFVI